MARIQPPPRAVHRHLRCPRGSVGRGVVLDGADRLPVVVDCLLVRPAERQQARAKKKWCSSSSSWCLSTWWELWLDRGQGGDHRQVRDDHWCPIAKTRRKRFIYTKSWQQKSAKMTFFGLRRCEHTQRYPWLARLRLALYPT